MDDNRKTVICNGYINHCRHVYNSTLANELPVKFNMLHQHHIYVKREFNIVDVTMLIGVAMVS